MTLSEWPTKTDAARRLGISERTIDRWISERKIERRYRAVHGRRPEPVVNPSDLDTLAATQAHVAPVTSAMTLTHEAAASPYHQLAQLGRLAALAGVAGDRHERFPLWLTIGQAIEYSGLTEGQLRKLTRAGSIRAIARPLRLSRDSIDSFAVKSDSGGEITGQEK